MNLDIIGFEVFGMKSCKQRGTDWKKQFKKDKGLQKGSAARAWLAESVEFGYTSLATIDIADLDDSIEYRLTFDNFKRLWKVELKNVKQPDSPDAEVDPKFKIDFMRDDLVKKIVQKAYSELTDAKRCLEDIVLQKVEAGDYIDIDETKLEAIADMLKDQVLMANLKKRQYVK